MDRLTERNATGVGYIGRHAQRVPGLQDSAGTMRVSAAREVLQRLADYEDTGLEPWQIATPSHQVADILSLLREIAQAGGMTRIRSLVAAADAKRKPCPYCNPTMREKEQHLYAIKTAAGQWVTLGNEDLKHCPNCGREIMED